MDSARLELLLHDLESDRRSGADVGERLCNACVDMLDVSGAGIMLMTDGKHLGTLGISDHVMTVVEELQFTLGEGPCIDAFRSAEPVHEPDLVEPAILRWPAFAGPAIGVGVRAVFGFPLRSGVVSLGALDLYQDHAGGLEQHQVADAVVLTGVISSTILALQADAAPDALADQIDMSMHHRAVVHQAAGMVSVQLGIDVADALVRVRAYAYSSDSPINEVAGAIVGRQFRLE